MVFLHRVKKGRICLGFVLDLVFLLDLLLLLMTVGLVRTGLCNWGFQVGVFYHYGFVSG